MTYSVHWAVNDGRYGYPNIVADLNWSDIDCRSYEQAIREHAKHKGVRKILAISETNSKGKIRGRNYRDFLVNYLAKDAPLQKALYLPGESIQKIIRVFGSYEKTRKHGVLEQEFYPA